MSQMSIPEVCAVRGKAGVLPGQVARYGDPLKHLGPPASLEIQPWSKLWMTRCGLQGGNMWYTIDRDRGDLSGRIETGLHDDDVWCPGCLEQAGIPHRLERI